MRWTNAVPPVQVGEQAEVNGVCVPNVYAPMISLEAAHSLGQADFPKPFKISVAELLGGRDDCRWTQVEGMVRSATTNSGWLVLGLLLDKQRLQVSILDSNEADPQHRVRTRLRA